MKIRSAMLSDTERICRTHRAAIEVLCAGHYSEQDIAGWIDVLSPGIYENAISEKLMVVAEDDAEILGLGILGPDKKEICAIYVHPRSTGTGVGKRILLELEYMASENGTDSLTLCSTVNALGFYEHHGFSDQGQAVHELPNGVKLECIRMRKTLNKN